MTRFLHYLLPVIIIFLFCVPDTQAQTINTDSLRRIQQQRIDSTRQAQQHIRDSTIAARKHMLDSMRAARQNMIDSIRTIQQHRTDSLKAIREYHQSSRYKDSIAAIRQHVRDSITAFRQHQTDSIMAARQRMTDSLIQARKHYNDSLRTAMDKMKAERERELALRRAEQQRRSDSLAAIRAYRSSQKYKDSVQAARQHRMDSMAAARKHYSDSIRAVQKAQLDSLKAERQRYNDSMRAYMDSMRAERQRQIDSMATIRQIRNDSLAKIREARKAERDSLAAKREKDKQLKLELKISKKKEAYSNESMRKKKWTIPRQMIQNTFTRYNYYFNADKKMDEAIDNMLRSKTDDFDSIIALFPFDPDIDSAKLASDMDTIIRKASVGIQIHDPRSKWQANLYLLVGQAYFYKADYKNAAASFKQIISEAEAKKRAERKKEGKKEQSMSFSEPDKTGLAGMFAHQSVENEAILWLARTLTQSDKPIQAETLLGMLRSDPGFPSRLRGRLALEQAFIELKNHNLDHAIKPLSIVSTDDEMPQWVRLRSSYIAGQILQQQQQFDSSTYFFKNAVSLHPDLEMDFYARKNIASNELKSGNDPAAATKLLETMIADGKYRPYLDQIYYALAKSALARGALPTAIENLRNSIHFNTNNKKQKGYSYASLGDVFYLQKKYTEAQVVYDSATMFLTPDLQPVYGVAQKRATSLREITTPARLVAQQDSLLHLASLPEKDQREVIRDYLRDLRKHISDSIFLAQNAGTQILPSAAANVRAGNQSWYFSNPMLVQQGINEFKQKWGDRKLADNWRLGTRSSGFSEGDMATDTKESNNPLDNLPDEDSLYATIPHSPEEIKKARHTLSEALFLLGKGYYTYLEDFDNALQTFDRLDREFPENEHQAEVLYERYLIALQQNNRSKADTYNRQLQTKFPDSDWAQLLASAAQSSQNEAAPQEGKSGAEYYDETYRQLSDRQYELVLSRINQLDKQARANGIFAGRYTLMEAIATAGTGNYLRADSMLKNFLKAHPDDSLTSWAQAALDYINGKTPGTSSVNTDSISHAEQAAAAAKLTYTYAPQTTHFVVIIAPADMRLFGLKAGIQDYNLMKEGRNNLVVSMTTFNPAQNMVLCKSFSSAAEASQYAKELKKSPKLFREYPTKDYHLLIISAENYPIFTQKKDIENYLNFYQKNAQ